MEGMDILDRGDRTSKGTKGTGFGLLNHLQIVI